MTVLVTYASKHGATQGIAERIGGKLRELGLDAFVAPIDAVRDIGPSSYDAYVIGSAAYYFHWMKEATRFVRRNRVTLAQRPVWLFSSGPLGSLDMYANNTDPLVTTIPKEFPALQAAIHPRGVRIFFGALDTGQLGFATRLFAKWMPAGDFRDWAEIEAWAEDIAHALAPSAATTNRGKEALV